MAYCKRDSEVHTPDVHTPGLISYGTVFLLFLTLNLCLPHRAFAARYGLFVGIDSYSNPGSNYSGSVNDAVGFRNTLLSDASLWDLDSTQMLIDEEATEAAIKAKLAYFAGIVQPGDLFVFYQSSHGGQAGSTADTYLYCYDGELFWDSELASSLSGFAAGVDIIVVIDAVSSGGLFIGNVGAPTGDLAFMTSSDYDEDTYRGAPYSVYTGYLLNGFVSGDGADGTSADGDVTFWELFSYAYPFSLGHSMTPQYFDQSLLENVIAANILSGPAGDPYEPDDSFNDAKTIADGEKQWRSILPVADRDYVSFTLSESRSVHVHTSGTLGDTELVLYNSAWSQLADDDNGGIDSFSSITRALHPGTYYVMVLEHGEDATLESYSLSLETSPAPTACVAGDDYCAMGCDNTNDADCVPICGNTVVEATELCDGNCPTLADCDDVDVCTVDSFTGDASDCDVQCQNAPITVCVGDDGCCAPGCDNTNDSDCTPVCGNSVVEATELCDGDCPTLADCDDVDACTADGLTGDASDCDAQCQNTPITACVDGDGCCAPSCDITNDNDCAAVCGNSVVDGPESCDDGNTADGDGCSATCTVETGWICADGGASGCCRDEDDDGSCDNTDPDPDPDPDSGSSGCNCRSGGGDSPASSLPILLLALLVLGLVSSRYRRHGRLGPLHAAHATVWYDGVIGDER